VLLSTHILPEVSITCRRVLILDHGKLVAEDTAEGLAAKAIGRGETTVKLVAPERDARAAFAELPGVTEVDVVGREPGGLLTVVIASRGGEDLRPRVAETAVSRGWKVFELAPKIISLEDLFVEILKAAEEKSA
jgi:ABC-2 type transport system ATP-binding protein